MSPISSSASSLLNTGLNGMQKSHQAIQQSASDVVRAGTVDKAISGTLDIAEPLLNIQQEQHVFDASAKVVSVADDLLGTLLDIKA